MDGALRPLVPVLSGDISNKLEAACGFHVCPLGWGEGVHTILKHLLHRFILYDFTVICTVQYGFELHAA